MVSFIVCWRSLFFTNMYWKDVEDSTTFFTLWTIGEGDKGMDSCLGTWEPSNVILLLRRLVRVRYFLEGLRGEENKLEGSRDERGWYSGLILFNLWGVLEGVINKLVVFLFVGEGDWYYRIRTRGFLFIPSFSNRLWSSLGRTSTFSSCRFHSLSRTILDSKLRIPNSIL